MSCQYPIPDSDGQKMNLFLFFASDKLTGHFTTDNLFGYLFWQSFMEVVDSEDEAKEGFTVCGADLKGTYDQTTGKYEYKGWCDLLTEDKELFRVPVTLQCKEWIYEETDEETEGDAEGAKAPHSLVHRKLQTLKL